MADSEARMTANRERFIALKDQAEQWRDELGVPGITFGISVAGERFTAGCGTTSVDNPLPVTAETIFQIGSITKTVTATALTLLQQRGELSLGDRVRKWLPDFRVKDERAASRVTVMQLLTHVAGWSGDVFTDTGSNDDACQLYVDGMAQFSQLAPTGTVFSYNNAAFAVAGRVIEVVTGQTFERAIQDLIFEPLGMRGSYFFERDVMLRRFAVGHLVKAGQASCLSPWAIPRGMNAAGGISCHIGDLLRYAEFHLGDGEGLLTGKSLSSMRRARVPINDYLGEVGLSWIMNRYAGKRVIGHTGGTNGQNAVLSLAPDSGVALGMMTNGSSGSKIHDRFNRAALQRFCGIDIPQPSPIASTVDELRQYEGVYKGTMREITLRLHGADLLADIRILSDLPSDRPPPEVAPATVARCGDDQLLVMDGEYEGARADFIRDANGEIQYLRFGSRINRRL